MNKLCGVFVALALGVLSVRSADAATCTGTGFMRDGIEMTAALINPAAPPSVVDATGCHIGIYIDHLIVGGVANIQGRDIYGASYFGVLVNGDTGSVQANLRNNLVHNIGEVPFNGAQHGVGIYIRAFFAGFNVTGEITGNTVFAYQKGGIVVNGRGGKISKVNNNRVLGQGHVTYIAQNGIQVGYGAMPYPAQVVGNAVSGNSYIGTPGDGSASAGILVVGGDWLSPCPDGGACPYSSNVFIAGNILFNNDTGVNVYNAQAGPGYAAPAAPTLVLIYQNLI